MTPIFTFLNENLSEDKCEEVFYLISQLFTETDMCAEHKHFSKKAKHFNLYLVLIEVAKLMKNKNKIPL